MGARVSLWIGAVAVSWVGVEWIRAQRAHSLRIVDGDRPRGSMRDEAPPAATATVPPSLAASPDATPSPSVRATARADSRLTGRVIDSENGDPVKRGTVTLALATEGEAPTREVADLGSDGRFTLDWARVVRGNTPAQVSMVRLSTLCERYAPGVLVVPLPRDGEQLAELTIRVDRLETVRGQILSQDGKPLADVDVIVCGAGGSARTRTASDGGFRVELHSPQRLLASDARHGSAHVARIAGPMPGDHEIRLPPITLVPRGSIAGVALLPDGRPARNVPVTAVRMAAAESASSVGAITAGGAGPCELARRPNAQVVTDAQGAFRFSDLDDGEYVLRAPTEASRTGTIEAPVRLGEEAARVLVPVRLVVLRLTDDSNRPATGATYSYEVETPAGEHPASGAGDVTRADGRLHLTVPTAGTLRFAARFAELEASDVEVIIRPDEWEVERTIVLSRAKAKGRVAIELFDAAGARVTPFYAFVQPADAQDTHPAHRATVLSWASSISDPLPPGEYVVDVLPGARGPVGKGPDVDSLAACRTLIRVEPGRDVVARAVAAAGGRVAVDVRSPGTTAPSSVRWEIRPRGSDIRVPGMWSSRDPERLVGVEIGSGRQRYSTPLPAGDYVLSLTVGGFQDVKREFIVRLGETTELDLVLTPR